MNGPGTTGFYGVLWVPCFGLQAALRQAQWICAPAGSAAGRTAGTAGTPAVLTEGRPPAFWSATPWRLPPECGRG